MNFRRFTYTAIILCLASASCEKWGADSDMDALGENISITIPTEGHTKGFVNAASDLKDKKVVIYAKKENGSFFHNDYNGGELNETTVAGIWGLKNGATHNWSEVGATGINATGYAYNQGSGSTVTNISNEGMNVTITQSKTYPSDGGTDYLLAHKFEGTSQAIKIGNATAYRGPVITLEMEHALSRIQVRAEVHKDIYSVTIKGIKVNGFYYGAKMTCDSRAVYGSGLRNRWSSATNTAADANYEKTGTLGTHNAASSNTIIELMDFIAVPQQLTSNTKLEIVYSITEVQGGSAKDITQVFNLNRFDNWEYGKRNIYTVLIDTSNKLVGTIEEWKMAGTSTATILPDIPDTEI